MMLSCRCSGLFSCTRFRQNGRNRLLQSRGPLQVLTLNDPTFLATDNDVSFDQRGNIRSFKSAAWRKRSLMVKNRLRLATARYKKPGQIQALSMPLSPPEMDNATLVMLAQLENHGAQIEVLKRHIMAVDKISYEQACEKYKEIAMKNREMMYLLSLPYQVGIGIAVLSGALSLPMVFHRQTADWFNKNFVTSPIPEPEDLETVLEIGAWAWNWMEPPLGTISFLLLTMQLARANMQNLGAKPYTERIKQWRAERLASAFPEYDAAILIQYSNSTSIHESHVEANA